MDADEIIATLGLAPHPEGGWYRQTWVADGPGRPAGTCIYFLLRPGERSHWHRVDAAEIWHFYTGASLSLRISATEAGAGFALVGCTVSPGFRFEGFELAPPDFDIAGPPDPA